MSSKKLTHHLSALERHLGQLESHGHLEPGQASAAQRAVRRLKRVLATDDLRKKQKRVRLHEAMSDLIAEFLEVDRRRGD